MSKTTKVMTACFWCNDIITMQPDFDEQKHKPMCSRGCRDAEVLFNKLFSNKRLNRKEFKNE